MSNDNVDEIPAHQGESEVGYCKPPKEHQFKPGQSGNPAGSPRPRTTLYKHISKYSGMTNAELAELDQDTMTQSQQAALKIVQDMAAGKRTGAGDMAKYVVDREESRIPNTLIVEPGGTLPPCDPEGRVKRQEVRIRSEQPAQEKKAER